MAAKTPGQRKTKGILIRVTEAQKRVLDAVRQALQ